MATVVIPKELSKNQDLIAVPRDIYEEFLTWQEKVKSAKMFQPTFSDRQALKRGRKNFKAGKFLTIDELRKKLGFTD